MCAACGFDPLAVADAYLRAGVRVLQVRVKDGRGARFLRLAERVVAAASPYSATVIVNDRADIARLSGAAGVHVGQDDLAVDAVRAIAGPGAVVGLSTHTPAQIDEALQGEATYVAVGPVFGTSTKETGYAACGIELVRYATGRGKPVVAIGGITLASAPEVIAAGAAAVAIIGDLLATRDPEARARAFLAALPPRPFNV